ncbi:hypothetical protein [Streptomyces purpureus]|uniref:Uncharacterized protein n=1 Tax=Streptomyces purpureus TaxID=1951 RepID=A0A918LMD5_9ACTN|nr:hypothetical protein [Streptomyces purpureus]GGT19013.1 hypothetical protein GCM10014713_09960 [Streptomyces purpureus]
MSQEAAPEQAMPEQPVGQSVPEQKTPAAPKGLLQQMEELMAALTADLSQLDADLQSSADRTDRDASAADRGQAAEHTERGRQTACAEGVQEHAEGAKDKTGF